MKDRYLEHLSEDENKMLDIMTDIITGYIMRKHEEQRKTDRPQTDLNHHSADSESIVCRKKKSKKKALEDQALSV